MGGINYARVLLGGLAAGVVANVCDFITGTFLTAQETHEMAQRLNLDAQLMASPSTAMTWAGIDFVYCILIVWVYAAIRPRLGPGAQTAIIAGLVVFASPTMILFGFQQMGMFAPDAFMKSTFFSLVTAVLASLTGCRMYKED